MKRQVIWSQDARRDLIEAVEYIAEDAPQAAVKLSSALIQSAQSLGLHSTGRLGRIPGVYEKSLPKYLYVMAYRIVPGSDGETISYFALSILRGTGPLGDGRGDLRPEPGLHQHAALFRLVIIARGVPMHGLGFAAMRQKPGAAQVFAGVFQVGFGIQEA